ncbi:MAG: class II fructose-bisphosphate aldolase, partial [Fusobacteriaceae bacterium]
HQFTRPEEVEEFVKRTGVDSLAIAIGTSHGAHKFKPGEDPKLRLDILEECERRLPGFPIVLHGSSEVPAKYIEMMRTYGGEISDAIGIPASELRGGAKSGVAKINVDTDGRLAFTSGIRKVLATNPKEFDPRKYLGAAKEEMKAYYKTKVVDVFGSEGAYKKASK